MATALITGASSGIGAELVRRHAAAGGDLILTARREDRLAEIKREVEAAHGVTAHVFAADLAKDGAVETLHGRIAAAGLIVDHLIANAGFGGYGAFLDKDLAGDLAMVDVNVKATMALCHRFGTDMAGRGTGRILIVGSTAGFLPGPRHATYFATKAFVNSFAGALGYELRGQGVTVTLLAPGYVETGFAERADLRGATMVRRGGNTADRVAKVGYEAMLRGDRIVFDRTVFGIGLRFLVPFVPRRWLLWAVERSQSP